MDRIISLLAALVGLIALGGAILVHVNGDVQLKQLAAQIAELRTATSAAPPAAGSAVPSALPSASAAPAIASASETPPSAPALDPQAAQISQLQERIAALEKQNSDQASQLAAAQARLADGTEAAEAPSLPPPSLPMPPPPSTSAPVAEPPLPMSSEASGSSASSSEPASSASAVADGPTSDCIPVGTRFVGKPGDSFPICKTKVVIKIAAVADGIATVDGAGPIAAGSFADLAGKGCSVMVFSADTTGFADLRVSCP